MYVEDLRELVIRPILISLGEWSCSIENLLLGTAAQESQLGFKMQSCQDNQRGLYRISPLTHIEVWDQYLVKDPELASNLRGLASQQQFLKSPHAELITNLGYATGIAWMIYRRHQPVLSENADPQELAKYWVDYYCSRETSHMQSMRNEQNKMNRFIKNFNKLVLCEKKGMAA
ncbi:MAG: hypothetical protein EOO52_10030 [Gammaproteobacteria bacterium]|nr:MAG: hypothetical protein EOO52_10030 [Gammaproteobacteria bacterium]